MLVFKACLSMLWPANKLLCNAIGFSPLVDFHACMDFTHGAVCRLLSSNMSLQCESIRMKAMMYLTLSCWRDAVQSDMCCLHSRLKQGKSCICEVRDLLKLVCLRWHALSRSIC